MMLRGTRTESSQMNIHAPRALVADDEGLVSMLIEDILTARGYQVTVANTRAQLESALKLDCWTLAVADTGLATFEEMQSWQVDRIILCTGKPKDYVEEFFPHIPYVAKPCGAEDFDAVLRDRPNDSDTCPGPAAAR